MNTRKEIDVVDVHVTSVTERVDAFTQYPLLDGTQRYTVEVTEFVCPLMQDALPDKTNTFDNVMFEIRRKRETGWDVQVLNVGSSLVTPLDLTPLELAANVFLPYGLFTPDRVQFRKNSQRPMATPGDLVYHLQRFFNDIIRRYTQTSAVAMANLVVQTAIANDAEATDAERAAAQALIDGPAGPGPGTNGLASIVAGAMPSRIVGGLHGGGPDVPVLDATRFVTVVIQPNGCLKLFFSPIFTKHFFLAVSPYGARMLGIGQDSLVAFRTVNGNVVQGLQALTNNAVEGTIIDGSTAETIEYPGLYSLERNFDHRVRLEIESQIGLPPTVVWSTDDRQKISHVIATFPIQMKSQSAVHCNSEGAATEKISFQSDVLAGDITWRRAEDKVTERYLLNNSQYFHNIRLDIFMVRKEWKGTEFHFEREKVSLAKGESWTAKLRFRSIS